MSSLNQNRNLSRLKRIFVIDSHTGGEPTRVVVQGGPELGTGPMDQQKHLFATQFDWLRTTIICEPRGSDIIVGALLTPPTQPGSLCGAIFFNNVGYLGMCGHGTIGLAATLDHMSATGQTTHFFGTPHLSENFVIDTPVGAVPVHKEAYGKFTIQNVVSYRYQKSVPVLVRGRTIHGDIAWGGNWFFLCEDHGLKIQPSNIALLMDFSQAIRSALREQAILGVNEAEIDHVELFSAPSDGEQYDSRNFVLCPGGAYDRSPCGTGTSAKLACLAADGKLAPNQIWRQESITGSCFDARYTVAQDGILPSLTGTAFITAESHLIIDPDDPMSNFKLPT